MQQDFIDATSPEGIEYRASIEKLLIEFPDNQAARDFLRMFDERGGCYPLDFLDYLPHGGIGTHGPGCKCELD